MQPTPASQDGIAHQVTHGPSFAMLRVDIAPGQQVTAEAGAMVAKNKGVDMDVSMNADPSAGLLSKFLAFFVALIRKWIAGETFFVNRFTAAQGGSVWIAPTMSGNIQYRRMRGDRITLSTGAYVAHSGNLRMGIKFGGLKSLLAKEGAFFMEISGDGDLWFTSYGGIHAIEVNGSYLVDNGHLVGFEGNLSYNIQSAGGGLKGLLASGEGVAVVFQGQGRVYIQSRNTEQLVSWLQPLMP